MGVGGEGGAGGGCARIFLLNSKNPLISAMNEKTDINVQY